MSRQNQKQHHVVLSEIVSQFQPLEETRSSVNQWRPFTSVLVIAVLAGTDGATR